MKKLPLFLVVLMLSGCVGHASLPVESVPAETNDTSRESSLQVLDDEETREKEMSQMEMLIRAAKLMDMLEEEGNIMVSPTSLYGALGMVMNGADGETLAQMESVLGVPVEELNALYTSLEDTPELRCANSVWYRDMPGTLPRESFVRQLEENYRAEAFACDFSVPRAVEQINSWVSEKTDRMIPKLLEKTDAGTVMVLVNTTLFEGKWMNPYEPHQVKESSFYLTDGEAVTASMMSSRERWYLENDCATGFVKHYQNGYRFAAVLPKEEGDFTLDSLSLDTLLDSVQRYSVDARMPRFTFESQAVFSQVLQQAGMTDAFDGEKADFSRMFEEPEGVCISSVIQKSRIELTETGTKAAAATAVTMAKAAMPVNPPDVKTVILNRPFAFVILDEEGLPLFLGKVMNPTA